MGAFRARLLVGLIAAVLCIGWTPKSLDPVGKREIAEFLKIEPKRDPEKQIEFEKRLAAALSERPDIGAAAKRLADEFGLTPSRARRLSDLWIQWVLLEENVVFSYDPDVSREESDRREASFKRQLHDAFIALVRDSGHARTVLSAAIKALTSYPYNCASADFSALAFGASRETTWGIVNEGDCGGFWEAINIQEPMNPATLLRMAEYGTLSDPERIAALERVRKEIPADGNQTAVDAYVARSLIYSFWDAGLLDAGLAVYEGLSPDARQLLLEGDRPQIVASLGGHNLEIPKKAGRWLALTPPPVDEFPLRGSHEPHEQLAAALLLKGRDAEARATLAASSKFGDGARALVNCSVAGGHSDCRLDSRSLRWIYLDLVLNRPRDDPYDLFEQSGASMANGWGSSGVWLQVLRKTADPRYRTLVDTEGKYWRPGNEYPHGAKERELLEATFDAPLRARIAEVRKLFDDVARTLGTGSALTQLGQRPSIPAPKNTHFAQLKLPACPLTTKAAPPTLDEKTFPPGYGPVRAEQRGADIVVVSLSQNYDPTGEVSAGGYWIHLSHDGGKTWEAPLYTGLAEHFPYVVSGESCLPLLAGDRLQIEAEIRELDTASISYPPVAMRTRRQERGLYLDISLSELRQDTDQDGLTDISEESLLLDPRKPDSDGDAIPDGKDPFPNVRYTGKHGPADGVITAIFSRLFETESGALIESVDRPAGEFVGAFTQPSASLDRPIFLSGEKSDFAGFSARQIILVYSKEELDRLRQLKPDFHAIELGPLILNRAGTRGYISWSAGWTGGKFRVVKDGDSWRVEDLSSWIT